MKIAVFLAAVLALCSAQLQGPGGEPVDYSALQQYLQEQEANAEPVQEDIPPEYLRPGPRDIPPEYLKPARPVQPIFNPNQFEAYAGGEESYGVEGETPPEFIKQQLPALNERDLYDTPFGYQDDQIPQQFAAETELEKPKEKPKRKPEQRLSPDETKKLFDKKVVKAEKYSVTLKFGPWPALFQQYGVVVTLEDGSQYLIQKKFRPSFSGFYSFTTVRDATNLHPAWKESEEKTIEKSTFGDFIQVSKLQGNLLFVTNKMMALA